MEREHTPTIIRLILSMDHALIQLKDSCFNSLQHLCSNLISYLSFLISDRARETVISMLGQFSMSAAFDSVSEGTSGGQDSDS